MKVKRRYVLAAGAAAYLIMMFVKPNAGQAETSPDTWPGTISRTRILDKSEDLCRAVLTISGAIQIKADAITMRSKHGVPRRFWTIDCYDAENTLAFMVWNADSGELESMYVQNKDLDVITRAISRKQAEQYGLTWISKLRFSTYNGGWRLVSPPEEDATSVRCRFASGNRVVSVLMHRKQGDFIGAKCIRS